MGARRHLRRHRAQKRKRHFPQLQGKSCGKHSLSGAENMTCFGINTTGLRAQRAAVALATLLLCSLKVSVTFPSPWLRGTPSPVNSSGRSARLATRPRGSAHRSAHRSACCRPHRGGTTAASVSAAFSPSRLSLTNSEQPVLRAHTGVELRPICQEPSWASIIWVTKSKNIFLFIAVSRTGLPCQIWTQS